MAIAIIIGMFYALTAQAIGPERDTPTAIVTLEQITTPSNPASGFNRIYSKGDDKLYTLNSAGDEVELGAGGAGSGRLNLLEDPSFEDGVAEGSCILCTAAEELTIVLGTLNNAKSLKLTQTSGLGAYTLNKTTSSEYLATQVAVSCWIKTSATGIQFKALSNAAPVITKEVSSDGNWNEYIIPFVAGTTSIGYQVTGGAASDIIYVDECFLGAKDILNKVGYDTGWEDYTPTFTGMGTVSAQSFKYRRSGDSIEVKGYFIAGTPTGVKASVSLPTGLSIDTSKVDVSNNDTSIGQNIGLSQGTGGTNFRSVILTATLSSTTAVYFGGSDASTTQLIPTNGNSLSGTGTNFSIFFKVPIQGWQATFDSISDVNQNETVTNTLNSDITTNTTLSDLTFSDLVIGARYQLSINAQLRLGASSIGTIDTTHDSVVIDRRSLRQSDAGDVIDINPSFVINFTATAPTITIATVGASAITVYGDGTTQKTYAQLRRIDNQINAILKDVVMSPNSSNGKPVIYSARISASGVVSNEVLGDFIDGNCTNTNPMVCTFGTSKFSEAPNCQVTGRAASDNTPYSCIIDSEETTAGFSFRCGTLATVIDKRVSCTGVRP